MSLGAARTFQIKGNWRGAPLHSLELKDGDLLTMEGMTQKHFQHRVPGPRYPYCNLMADHR